MDANLCESYFFVNNLLIASNFAVFLLLSTLYCTPADVTSCLNVISYEMGELGDRSVVIRLPFLDSG